MKLTNTVRKLAAALAMGVGLVISGCGGGGETPTPPAAPRAEITSLVFVGNSITKNGPAPEIGWNGDWGMAASAQTKDHAHLTSAALSLPLQVFNTRLVNDEWKGLTLPLNAGVAVIVQLAENDPQDDAAFRAAYPQALAVMQPRGALVCLGPWWGNTVREITVKQLCEQVGGKFVSVSDIYDNPANPDRNETQFTNPGVAMHPHDWGMARIAERVTAAIR